MTKKIVVVGDIQSENIGDPLLVANYVSILRAEGAEVYEWDINNYSGSQNSSVEQKISSARSVKKLIHRYTPKMLEEWYYFLRTTIDWSDFEQRLKSKKIDAVVFAGGQMFMSYYVRQITDIVKISRKFGVPVYFNAIGVGNLDNPMIKRELSKALDSEAVKKITVRDELDTIQKLTKKDVTLVIDSVSLANMVYRRNKSTVQAGIGVIYRHGFENLIKTQIQNVVQALENQNIEWKFFSNGDQDDYLFGLRILEDMGYSEQRMVPRPASPEELINTVTGFDRIIAYRLHAHIIAYAFNIPSFGLAWNHKVFDFLKVINHSERVVPLNKTVDVQSKLKNIMAWNVDEDKKRELTQRALKDIKNLVKDV